MLQDTESKLKEANSEITKLMSMVADLQAKLASNVSNVDSGNKKGTGKFQHVVNSLVNSIRKAKAEEILVKKATNVPMKQVPVIPTSPTRGSSEEEVKTDPNVVKMPVMRRRSSLMQRSIDPHDLDVIRKLSGMLTHSLMLTYSFTHSLTCLLTHSCVLTHSLTHSLILPPSCIVRGSACQG